MLYSETGNCILRNLFIKFYQIVAIALIVLLAISTFIPQRWEYEGTDYTATPGILVRALFLDRFYESPISAALWLVTALLMILGILFRGVKNKYQVIQHLTIALVILVVFYDKSNNERFFISLKEGKSIHFSDYLENPSEKYNIDIKLSKFEIQYHPQTEIPSAFISHIIIDDKDSITLGVNKPLSMGKYRLYQNAYDRHLQCNILVVDKKYQLCIGDSIQHNGTKITLKSYDHQTQEFCLFVDGDEIFVRPHREERIGDLSITVQPSGFKYESVIEVAEVIGLKLLLLLSIIYMSTLILTFWWRI